MDWLSRIVAWLSDHEAAISAVAAIIAILLGFPCKNNSQPVSQSDR